MLFKKSVMTAAVFAVGSFATISSANAAAESTSSTFGVEMTVEKICTVTAGNKISLVAKAGVKPAIAGSAINVKCSKTTPFTISMLPGGVATTTGKGLMKHATNGATTGPVNNDSIEYTLTTNLDGTTPWATDTVDGSGAGTATDIPYTVYANVTATNLATVTPAVYSETVTVAVNY